MTLGCLEHMRSAGDRRRPAGSACAQALAGAGLDVLLVDQHAFPRDKTCGDWLIPDAQRALSRLGLLDAVLARARVATHVGCVGPGGGRGRTAGAAGGAAAPRARRAAAAGGCRARRPLARAGALRGAAVRCRRAGWRAPGWPCRTAARGRCGPGWTVLATGAAAGPLLAAGVCERRAAQRHRPAGLRAQRGAGRARRRARGGVAPALRGGYGWIFPCRDGVFNIGVGLTRGRGAAAALPEANLRACSTPSCACIRPRAS